MAKGSEVSRRALLAGGAGVAGVTLLALSGCSTGGSTLAGAASTSGAASSPASSGVARRASRSAAKRSTHPSSEHPKSEHPASKHPSSKHPSSEHASSGHPSAQATHEPSPSHTQSSAAPEPSRTKSSAPPAGPPSGALAKLSSIPVGGSISATDRGKPITLSQPQKGTVACFSAICTHQGCTVNAGGPRLHCPCHGSIYDAFTGAVIQGPAPDPLPRVATRIVDGYVVRG